MKVLAAQRTCQLRFTSISLYISHVLVDGAVQSDLAIGQYLNVLGVVNVRFDAIW